jgi:hypothetical protein
MPGITTSVTSASIAALARGRKLKRLGSVARDQHFISGTVEDARGEVADHSFVLGHQDPPAADARRQGGHHRGFVGG